MKIKITGNQDHTLLSVSEKLDIVLQEITNYITAKRSLNLTPSFIDNIINDVSEIMNQSPHVEEHDIVKETNNGLTIKIKIEAYDTLAGGKWFCRFFKLSI